jgi:hypothetical protein
MAHDKSKRDDTDNEPQRQGDVLGLGGSVVPKSSVDPSAEFDEESVAQRHARSRGENEDQRRENTAFKHGAGATGVDMGAGGTGTDVE